MPLLGLERAENGEKYSSMKRHRIALNFGHGSGTGKFYENGVPEVQKVRVGVQLEVC